MKTENLFKFWRQHPFLIDHFHRFEYYFIWSYRFSNFHWIILLFIKTFSQFSVSLPFLNGTLRNQNGVWTWKRHFWRRPYKRIHLRHLSASRWISCHYSMFPCFLQALYWWMVSSKGFLIVVKIIYHSFYVRNFICATEKLPKM